jgi:uncharacterized Fe-S cluster protein YjdI
MNNMEEKEIHYSNQEVTVVWRPHLCIHSGVCVRTLPKVYNPKDKPWVKVHNATTQELIDQIKQCPSGALSYKMDKEKK